MRTMMRAAAALLVSISLLGCFPHNPKARTYAKLGEGGAILTGIAISAFANTTADCDEMKMPGVDDSGCRGKAQWLSTAGVVLVLGGLLGFVATVSTAEDEAKPKPVVLQDQTPKPAEHTAVKLPGQTQEAGSADAAATGSAATGSAATGSAATGSAATTPAPSP